MARQREDAVEALEEVSQAALAANALELTDGLNRVVRELEMLGAVVSVEVRPQAGPERVRLTVSLSNTD